MKKLKILSTAFFCLILITLTVISASALSWEGSSSGGGGGGTTATNASFAIYDTDEDVVMGYRFSVVNSSGTTVSTYNAIDIFRNYNFMSSDYKFSTKYNKAQLIALQNNSFSTSVTTKYLYKQSEFSFASDLPDTADMDTWATKTSNINPILYELGFSGGVSDLSYGYKVLVEPIFRIKLEGTYHSLTLTEIALYGKYYLGASSDGGSSWDTGTWGFISVYTNKHFANWLYTTDGMGLWTNASYLSSQATFYNIINKGYGVGIAYAVTTPNTGSIVYNANGGYVILYAQWEANTGSIVYNANGGSLSSSTYSLTGYSHVQNASGDKFFHTLTYGVTANPRNATTFGLTKTGYTFLGWNTSADGSGTFFDQSTDYAATKFVSSLSSSSGGYVILYAQWEVNTSYIWYNPNGGTLDSERFDLYSGTIRRIEDLTRYFDKITYNTACDPVNASTFGLTKTGYTFVGWNSKADGTGTFFDQNTSYYPTEYKSTIATTTGGYVTLYAQWEVNTSYIWYNPNGGTLDSERFDLYSGTIRRIEDLTRYFDKITYNTACDPVNASTFGLTKTGYTFVGWNSKADGTGTFFDQNTSYYPTEYKSTIATTTGGYVTLYAQWEANTYTIKYDANGGVGAPTAQTKTYGVSLTLSSTKPTMTGYTFSGWNTNSSGTGTNYSSEASYTTNASVTLYAQWTANTAHIWYNPNGGTLTSTTFDLYSGTIRRISDLTRFFDQITYNTACDPYNAATFGLTKSGFSFIGWNTEPDGSGTFFDQSTNYYATDYKSTIATTTGGYVILYAQWESTSDIYPEYIVPNSDYRQGTEIIVSFNIINSSNYDFNPSSAIETSFTATSTDTNGVTTQIYNSVNDVIVPSNEQNLVYYKIEVPDDAKTLTFTMTAQTDSSINEVNYENNSITIVKDVATVINSQTADTIFISTPSNFYLPSISASVPTLGMVVENNASWSVWEWVNNDFTLETYGIKFEPIIVLYSASLNSSTMKSGYGFGFFSTSDITPDSNYNQPSADSYTIAQNGAVFFPEFSYSSSIGMYRSLTFIEQNSVFVFAENPYSINSQGSQNFSQLHYVPLYFPNGEYAVKSLIYDVWTPAGMIASTTTSTITIDGSVYDDWYAH